MPLVKRTVEITVDVMVYDDEPEQVTIDKLVAKMMAPITPQFTKLYAYVQAMVRDNVAHKTKGFRLGEMTLMDMIGHLGDEAFEVQTAQSKLDRQMEIADMFGIVLHMAIAEGMTPEQLVGATSGKLQIRFEAPKLP